MTTPTTPMTSAPPPLGRERLVWPDVAKGACILLVVLHHVILKDYIFLVGATFDPIEDVWHDVTYGLKPVRMPLFFVVSGFFAAGAVTRPWRTSCRRIVSGYYLYVVWLTVFMGVYALERDLPANRVVSVADFFGELLWAASSMWFLYALAVYFVLAKALRRLPPAVVVGTAAALAVSVSWLGIEENNRFSVLVHLVYFLVGAYYPQAVRRVADHRLRVAALLGLACAYSVAAGVVLYSGLPWSPTAFAASLLGIPLGIALAVRCSSTRVGAGLAWIGRRTLRVYVLHLIVLVALVQLPLALGEDDVLGLISALGYPIVMTGLVVAACLGLHQLLVRLRLGWLFALPARLNQRLAAGAEAVDETGQPAPAGGENVPSDARSGITE
ncbi:acyltransferase [soil metagenome]